MGAEVAFPREFVETLCQLRFPQETDALLQDLMDRNTEGTLSEHERRELEALVELNETLSLIRAKALQSLGRKP
jgi:hypothetical protein